MGSAGQEAVELAAIAGLDLDPWQQDVLEGSLAERADGSWASTEVGLIVPRQNGKGSVLEARELFGMVLGGETLITHTAHRFDTAQEHFRRMVALFEVSDDLYRKVSRIRYANGDEGIELKNGARLNFKARAKGSGRGFAGVDLIVLDEAYYLHELSSMLPSMAANPNMQVWYTSSAPLLGPESDVLRKIISDGRRGGGRMAFYEWSVPHGSDPSDKANWYAANPALGRRLSEEFTQTEYNRFTADEFARERLGMWNPDEATPREIPSADWDACADSLSAPSDPITFGLEMSRDRMTASIGACGDWQGHSAVTVVDHRDGVLAASWVPARLVELQKHNPVGVVVDDKTLGPDDPIRVALVDAGVNVIACDTKGHIAACAGLFDDVISHELRHPDLPVLTSSVAAARKRDVGAAWLWKGSESIPLIAVGLARWGHLLPKSDVDMSTQIW